MSVEIAIVAHPVRKRMAEELRDKVDAAAIAWDYPSRGAFGNHQLAWQYLLSADADWVCVLEDDAIPVHNFRHQLDQVLARCPGDIVSLYLGRGRPDQWQLPISSVICQDVSFLRARTLLHAVGYAIRTPLLGPLDLAIQRLSGRGVELSEGIGRWARGTGREIFYCRPSIVQHDDGPPIIADADREDGQSRSVPPNPSAGVIRKAWLFGDREQWDSSWVQIPPPDLRRRDKISPQVIQLHP